MNERTLKRLGVALAALVLVWIGLGALGRARRDTAGRFRLTTFDPGAADHARLTHGADTLTFARTGTDWTVNGLRADAALVHSLVADLADTAAPSELVSENAATLTTLGLDSLHAHRIRVLQGGRILADLLVGTRADYGTLIVRRPGEDAAYKLTSGLSDLVDKPLDGWRDRTIADVPPDSVAAVDVTRGRTRYSLKKAASRWEMGGAPADSSAVALLLGRFHMLNADGFATGATADTIRRARPGRSVRLLDAGGRPLLALHVDSSKTGYFAWRDGDSTVYRMEDWDTAPLTPPDSTLRPKPKPAPGTRKSS